MAAADILTVPPGWRILARNMPKGPIPAVVGGQPALTQVFQVDSVDMISTQVNLGPVVLGQLPNVQAQLTAAAQRYGSTLYGFAVLQTVEWDILGIVKRTRFRFIMVHRFFPALALLIGFFAVAVIALAVFGQATAQEQLNKFIKQLCQMFGPGCIASQVTNAFIAYALLAGGIGLLGIYVASKAGDRVKVKPVELSPPALPRVPEKFPKTTISGELPGPKGKIGATIGGD